MANMLINIKYFCLILYLDPCKARKKPLENWFFFNWLKIKLKFIKISGFLYYAY